MSTEYLRRDVLHLVTVHVEALLSRMRSLDFMDAPASAGNFEAVEGETWITDRGVDRAGVIATKASDSATALWGRLLDLTGVEYTALGPVTKLLDDASQTTAVSAAALDGLNHARSHAARVTGARVTGALLDQLRDLSKRVEALRGQGGRVGNVSTPSKAGAKDPETIPEPERGETRYVPFDDYPVDTPPDVRLRDAVRTMQELRDLLQDAVTNLDTAVKVHREAPREGVAP